MSMSLTIHPVGRQREQVPFISTSRAMTMWLSKAAEIQATEFTGDFPMFVNPSNVKTIVKELEGIARAIPVEGEEARRTYNVIAKLRSLEEQMEWDGYIS